MAESSAQSSGRDDPVIAAVLASHATHLDETQVARLRERAERLRRQIMALATYHLENGDEPDASFRPGED